MTTHPYQHFVRMVDTNIEVAHAETVPKHHPSADGNTAGQLLFSRDLSKRCEIVLSSLLVRTTLSRTFADFYHVA